MKGTILLAEDDRNLRRVLQATLEREGYEVASAQDGAAAAEWLDTQRADALITDIRMPKMDGLALFRHCRERHPGLPERALRRRSGSGWSEALPPGSMCAR
jgi:DNA-binding NtrC family response regulator